MSRPVQPTAATNTATVPTPSPPTAAKTNAGTTTTVIILIHAQATPAHRARAATVVPLAITPAIMDGWV